MPYNRKAARERGPSPFTDALRAAGYTLATFAEKAGVTYNHVVNVSRGRSRVSAEVRRTFAEVCGYDVDQVVEADQLGRYVRHSTESPGAKKR